MLLSYVNVPILLDVLDSTNYGIWLTVSSIVTWFAFFDVGLGHGLRNKLSEAIAGNNNTLLKQYVSTSYFFLILLSTILILIFYVFIPRIDWFSILNISFKSDIPIIEMIFVVFSLFAVNLTLKLINSVLYAIQKPSLISIISLISQSLVVLCLVFMKYRSEEYTLLDYSIALSLIPNIVALITSIFLFNSSLKAFSPNVKNINLSLLKPLFGIGSQFFLVQLTSIALVQTNSFIIAHNIDFKSVTEYNISYKLFSVISMGFSLVTAPLWSATTDAFYSRDITWIFSMWKKMNKLYIISIGASLILLISSPLIYRLWLNDKISVNWLLMFLMFLYTIISLKNGIYCSFLNGIGKIRLQIYITSFQAVIHLPLAFFLSKEIGIYGVLISMITLSAVNLFWEPIQLNKLLKGRASGIWNK